MVRTLLTGLMLLVPAVAGTSGVAGVEQATPGTESKASGKAAKPEAGLPAGAEKSANGSWRYKDPSGKVWIYDKTPFGFSRRAESADKVVEDEAAKPRFRIVEVKGDSITFENPTPFGKPRWTRQRAELTKDEKLSLEAYEKDLQK